MVFITNQYLGGGMVVLGGRLGLGFDLHGWVWELVRMDLISG